MTITNGSKVYYTGDMANASGNFTVTAQNGHNVLLTEVDGDRKFWVYPSQIGNVYAGHCNPRFVTEEARQAYRARAVAVLSR